MKHSYKPHFLRCITASFLLVGIATVFTAGTKYVFATVFTGQGTTVVDMSLHAAPGEEILRTSGADVPLRAFQDDVEARLIVGMLLVLAGFGFHALSVVRTENHAAPKRTQTRKRKTRFQAKPARALHAGLRRRLA